MWKKVIVLWNFLHIAVKQYIHIFIILKVINSLEQNFPLVVNSCSAGEINPAFHRTKRFIIFFTKSRYWTLSSAR